MTVIDEQLGGEAGVGVGPGPDPFVQMAFVDQALNDLHSSDLAQLDDEWFAQLVGSANRLAARFDAFQIDAAIAAEGRGRGRSVGFFSTKSYIKHHAQLSGVEARVRMQTTRMFELLPNWADAAHQGEVGVDQTRLMARVAGNPRIHVDLIANCDALLWDAMSKSFDEFERLLRNFARSADPDGAKSIAERNRDRRDFQIIQQPDGGWKLTRNMGSLQGAEIAEIFAHFVDAEFASDWATAVEIDPGNPMAHLARNEPNRRADALTAALLAAAQAPGDETHPDNCGALCGRHNRLKHRGGFTARRDHNGNWIIRDTDGNPIG